MKKITLHPHPHPQRAPLVCHGPCCTNTQCGPAAPHGIFSYPYLGKKLPRPLRLCYLAYHMKDVAKERIDKSDWVSLDNMPAYLPQALIATEDRRFNPTSASIPVPSYGPCSSIFSTTKSPKAAVL